MPCFEMDRWKTWKSRGYQDRMCATAYATEDGDPLVGRQAIPKKSCLTFSDTFTGTLFAQVAVHPIKLMVR